MNTLLRQDTDLVPLPGRECGAKALKSRQSTGKLYSWTKGELGKNNSFASSWRQPETSLSQPGLSGRDGGKMFFSVNFLPMLNMGKN